MLVASPIALALAPTPALSVSAANFALTRPDATLIMRSVRTSSELLTRARAAPRTRRIHSSAAKQLLPAALGLTHAPRVEPSHRPDDSHLWLKTQLIDYSWLGLLALVVTALFGRTAELSTVGLAASCAALGVASVAILQYREVLHFRFLAGRIPKSKRRALPERSFPLIFQTAAASMVSYGTCAKLGLVYFSPPSFTLSFWLSIFGPFYALLALRDVFFLGPLHPILHSRRWWDLHKVHHEPTKSAQSMHAFHIDLPDLIIENVGAPFLLFAAQLLAGRRVGIHWLVGVLLTSHDGALHSVNPHSAMYFNPVLDRVFKANVFHQLHHATSRGYYRFVPWAHVLPARRRADCARYNEVFDADFEFR